MRILAIESSCDDTSVALTEITDGHCKVIKEATASQIEIHKTYGGVVPEVAARHHAKNIIPLIRRVLEGENKPDYIAVTYGPGLAVSLAVGAETAKTLSYLWDLPLVAVNHIEGHLYSVLVNNEVEIKYPMICLTVSGGHSMLVLANNQGDYKILGTTRDDAAGECFDKVAKLMKLPYPGGPQIAKYAKEGNSQAIEFPRPMIDRDNYDFSFSGLKTAVRYYIRDNENYNLADVCASFEQAIVEVLVYKTIRAVLEHNPHTVILAGGVGANQKLRALLKKALEESTPSTQLLIPHLTYNMDNAAMIAAAAFYKIQKNDFTSWKSLAVNPELSLV